MTPVEQIMSRGTTWKCPALLLPLIFIIGCSAVNKQPLSIGDPGRWVDSDGHEIALASPPSGRVGHFVKYTDGPYRGKVYEVHKDDPYNARSEYYIQRVGKKIYLYFTGMYGVTDEAWLSSDGYEMGWAFPPPGMPLDGIFVGYAEGPYIGQVYQVHEDEQGKYYIERDGEKVYIHHYDFLLNED